MDWIVCLNQRSRPEHLRGLQKNVADYRLLLNPCTFTYLFLCNVCIFTFSLVFLRKSDLIFHGFLNLAHCYPYPVLSDLYTKKRHRIGYILPVLITQDILIRSDKNYLPMISFLPLADWTCRRKRWRVLTLKGKFYSASKI